ncbi:MAG: hypothetical protein GTO63_22685 [Anaerolineae bacterium]|nr:hypothetical protein [Anaerolineae bacterium]NIN96108.1 hypothetical protein [Anaerolineae bacterium]NIQ80528.1 hypothetical protein [Anaerolineae bacterium]
MSERLSLDTLLPEFSLDNPVEWVTKPCRYCGREALFPRGAVQPGLLAALTDNFSPPHSNASYPESWACCRRCWHSGGKDNYGKRGRIW